MKQKTQKELLQQFIDCMTFSSGAAWQMVHTYQDPRFLEIRNALEAIKNNCMQIAMGPSDDVASRLRSSGLIIP